MAQLRREFGKEPLGVTLHIAKIPSSISDYMTVEAIYEPWKTSAMRYVNDIEKNPPKKWDAKAREFIRVHSQLM